eukprot:12288608-Alexandrium_andersonii.AAC.1
MLARGMLLCSKSNTSSVLNLGCIETTMPIPLWEAVTGNRIWQHRTASLSVRVGCKIAPLGWPLSLLPWWCST